MLLKEKKKTTEEHLAGGSAALGNFLELRDFCAGNFCRHFSFKWKFLLKEEQQSAHLVLP